jgi:hypothetical protein
LIHREQETGEEISFGGMFSVVGKNLEPHPLDLFTKNKDILSIDRIPYSCKRNAT